MMPFCLSERTWAEKQRLSRGMANVGLSRGRFGRKDSLNGGNGPRILNRADAPDNHKTINGEKQIHVMNASFLLNGGLGDHLARDRTSSMLPAAGPRDPRLAGIYRGACLEHLVGRAGIVVSLVPVIILCK